MPRTGRRRLPRYDPIAPPTIAGTARYIPSVGRKCCAEKYPTNPPIEFTKIKSADIAAACLIAAQRQKRRSGVRKIPPPVPVRPERNPSPAPTPIATGLIGGFVSAGSLLRKNNRLAENSSTTPIRIRSTPAEG